MSATPLAKNFLAEARGALAACSARVRHCLGQLSDEQIWRRPRDSMGSVGNLVLRVCGSLRQRILSAVAGAPDDRDRAGEFSERGPIPKAELLSRLEQAVSGSDAVLAGLGADNLLEGRRYRGLKGEIQETVLSLVVRTLLHLSGHAQEIVYITRLQLGDAYRLRAAAAPRADVIAADDVVFERGMLPSLTPPVGEREAVAASRVDSPLNDPLLELEQEYQDQDQEGRL